MLFESLESGLAIHAVFPRFTARRIYLSVASAERAMRRIRGDGYPAGENNEQVVQRVKACVDEPFPTHTGWYLRKNDSP